ncbi:MAG TPA: NAD(+) synthase [Sedimentisphaerales bacterium]|nr:NAD(+) synthase [Sedimentisphaerales bacterium]
MGVSDSYLAIDVSREAEAVQERIRDAVRGRSAKGVILGLSGGIDSSVVATLAVRALGKEWVWVYYLYDRDSSKESRSRAEMAADWLGIELKCVDITGALAEEGVYSPLIIRVTGLSGFVNSFLGGKLCRLFWREPFFATTLRRGDIGGGKIRRFVYKHTLARVEAAFNARHRYRRKFLEAKAVDNNCVLAGAANRSEYMVGWFVKDGIDDVLFSPIIHLYKTQVVQLGEYLGVPAEIVRQPASPDMMKGVTDESAMAVSYETIDRVLVRLEHGMSEQEILSAGVKEKELVLVHTMNELSAWKRQPKEDCCSLVPDGGFRND